MKKKLIILAAGQGTRLQPLTDDSPKCMVGLAGKSLLEWQISVAERAGFTKEDIIVVGGYKAEKIPRGKCTLILNERYAETNMVQTLRYAEKYFGSGIIVSYGDIVYTAETFDKVVNCRHEVGVVVDHDWHPYWIRRFTNVLSDAESLNLDNNGRILGIGQKADNLNDIQGQYIGLTLFQSDGIKALRSFYQEKISTQENVTQGICTTGNLDALYMTDMLQGLINKGNSVFEIPIHGGWVEIDSISDLELAKLYCRSEGNLIKINRTNAY